MPIEMNRINKECPQCKSPTIFNVDGKKRYCGKCGYEADILTKPENITSTESASIQQEEIKSEEPTIIEDQIDTNNL